MEAAILLLTDRVLDFKEQLKRAELKLKTCSDKHKPTFQKARDNIQRWIDECNQARLILQNADALNELSKEGKFTQEQLYSAVKPDREELIRFAKTAFLPTYSPLNPEGIVDEYLKSSPEPKKKEL